MILLDWGGVESLPILLANQVIGQVGQQGEVIISFGQSSPPILIGTPEQQREQAKEITSLPVTPVARIALTRTGLDEMIRILNETRDNWDTIQAMLPTPTQEGGEL